MSITCAAGQTLADDTDRAVGDVYTIPSMTFASGKLYLLGISEAGTSTGFTASQVPSGGPTWVLEGNQRYDPNSSSNGMRLLVYSAIGGGETAAVTVNPTSGHSLRCLCAGILELDPVNTGAALAQKDFDTDDASAALTSTLGTFASSNNATVAFAAIQANTTLSADAGWTRLIHEVSTSPNNRLAAFFRNDNDTTPTCTAGASNGWAMWSAEVVQAGATILIANISSGYHQRGVR